MERQLHGGEHLFDPMVHQADRPTLPRPDGAAGRDPSRRGHRREHPPGRARQEEILQFATRHCGTDEDLRLAAPVLADLRRVAGDGEQRLAERALASLLTHWPAVEALAQAFIADRRIEGMCVEQIIDRSLRLARS